MPNTSNFSVQVVKILQSLMHKTMCGQAIWLNDGEMLAIHLPTVHILLGMDRPSEEKTEYSAVIALPSGKEVTRVTVSPESPHYPLLEQMYAAAQEASLAHIAREVQKSVSEQDMIGTTTTAPPELPAQPTVEQAQSFLDSVRGEWHLDYTRGQEDVSIDANGNYFVLSLKDGQPISTTARPKFHLELLSCNSALTTVEMAKVLPNGRTLQIEVLDVTKDKLSGYAKHDGQKVVYTRR